MVYLTRHEFFNAAHRLSNPKWSDEKNQKVFGKCANANWHGHNYELIVTVKGSVNPETGFLMDVKTLSNILQMQVCEALDHKNLNLDVPFLKNILPSTENLCICIWDIIVPHLPENVFLHRVKLYETPKIYVEYFGPGPNN